MTNKETNTSFSFKLDADKLLGLFQQHYLLAETHQRWMDEHIKLETTVLELGKDYGLDDPVEEILVEYPGHPTREDWVELSIWNLDKESGSQNVMFQVIGDTLNHYRKGKYEPTVLEVTTKADFIRDKECDFSLDASNRINVATVNLPLQKVYQYLAFCSAIYTVVTVEDNRVTFKNYHGTLTVNNPKVNAHLKTKEEVAPVKEKDSTVQKILRFHPYLTGLSNPVYQVTTRPDSLVQQQFSVSRQDKCHHIHYQYVEKDKSVYIMGTDGHCAALVSEPWKNRTKQDWDFSIPSWLLSYFRCRLHNAYLVCTEKFSVLKDTVAFQDTEKIVFTISSPEFRTTISYEQPLDGLSLELCKFIFPHLKEESIDSENSFSFEVYSLDLKEKLEWLEDLGFDLVTFRSDFLLEGKCNSKKEQGKIVTRYDMNNISISDSMKEYIIGNNNVLATFNLELLRNVLAGINARTVKLIYKSPTEALTIEVDEQTHLILMPFQIRD